jgi:RES domain-containing protein
MGLVKSLQIEEEERGWHSVEKFVCKNCVQDPYLQDAIASAACSTDCEYCGQTSNAEIAAPFDTVMELVANAVHYYFSDPNQSGLPYDEDWIIAPKGTDDVLMSIDLECHEDLFADVRDAFYTDAWVPAADGHWASSHLHQVYSYSWHSFSHWVKHETRFFFRDVPYNDGFDEPQQIPPSAILPVVAGLVRDAGLVKTRAAGETLYRVRERKQGETWPIEEVNLGAPPSDRASGGRMNPAGISYCYLALQQAAAISEVIRQTPSTAVIASFTTTRDLRVLDLTDLPDLPSIFDSTKRAEGEVLRFLRNFIGVICERVVQDDRVHIEYVPSQVVSEYFALMYHDGNRQGIDGIVYPSSVTAGGKNVVLFPTERGPDRKFAMLQFANGVERAIDP